ncbi:hypothetical protein KOI35_11355 [Actinoplanes bogorensis]|uniref:Uncharacterized protein n=1 Tax=Paractinoplanes bogorensis TaxID=1610840 RepID=A0ABS5YL18_9ACTN|nr:hypothetical protein [Actinoplanes bogorensis]MBU2664088.1 hypothetical protein [Actinoplanes bogorensis]
MTSTVAAPPARRGVVVKVLLALLGAAVLALPAALVAQSVASAVQPDLDPITTAAAVYPGAALQADADPFANDRPAWLNFMTAREPGQPYVAPSDKTTPDAEAARAQGWQIGPGLTDSYRFSATKGDARLDVYDDFTIVLKQDAWWVTALALLAGLLGAALGGWLALSAGRLVRAKTPRSRTVIRETAVVGLALLVPVLAQTILKLFHADTPNLPYSAQLLLELARWPAVLGVLVLAAAVAAVRWAPTSRPAIS